MRLNKNAILIFALLNLASCGETPTSHLTEQFPILRSGPHDMEFSFIPNGLFLMGETGCEDRYCDDPHWVKLTKDYWAQTTEVNRGQWHAVMGRYPDRDVVNGRNEIENCLRREKVVTRDDHPVVCVTWFQIQDYVKELNRKTKGDGYVYSLPTEAQWEYATRSYTEKALSIDGPLDSFAWYRGNSNDRSHVGGQLKPNYFGLYDVYGNVSEWVIDDLVDYELADDPFNPLVDPVVNKDPYSNKSIRGGGWYTGPSGISSSNRTCNTGGNPVPNTGFRVVRVESNGLNN